jgi:hypothetical protein
MRTKNLRCLKKILTVLAVAGALFLATSWPGPESVRSMGPDSPIATQD